MAISAVAGNYVSIPVLRIAQFSYSGSRMSVPMRPSQSIFAHYRHVFGTPAALGEKTVPLSRVRLLNRLIDILRKKKNTTGIKMDISLTNTARADSLIQQYASELHQAMNSAPLAFNALGTNSITGMLFNTSV